MNETPKQYTERRKQQLEEAFIKQTIPDPDEREDFYRFRDWFNSNPGPEDTFRKR